MVMPGRSYTSSDYRYGFNGMERDDELAGGSSYDFGARMYDARIGKFLSSDPKEKSYPYWSPYLYAANTPIWAIDMNGEGPIFKNREEAKRTAKDVNSIMRANHNIEFDVVHVVEETRTVESGWWIFKETTIETVITLKTNDEFNWNSDEYTAEFHDFVEMKQDITINISPHVDPVSPGGQTSENQITVSESAPNYCDNECVDAPTFGGFFLHEALYHIMPLGKDEYFKREAESKGSGTAAADDFKIKYGLKPEGHNRIMGGRGHVPQPYLMPFGIHLFDGDNSVTIPPAEQTDLDEKRTKSE